MDSITGPGIAYGVIAHREVTEETDFWVFEIPELGEPSTVNGTMMMPVGQALSRDEIEDEARGIIAAWNDDGSLAEEIRVSVRFDGELEQRSSVEDRRGDTSR